MKQRISVRVSVFESEESMENSDLERTRSEFFELRERTKNETSDRQALAMCRRYFITVVRFFTRGFARVSRYLIVHNHEVL